jgi:hypothetical protein
MISPPSHDQTDELGSFYRYLNLNFLMLYLYISLLFSLKTQLAKIARFQCLLDKKWHLIKNLIGESPQDPGIFYSNLRKVCSSIRLVSTRV